MIIIIYHYSSLFIIIPHYLLLNIYHYLSLFIVIYHYLLLFNIIIKVERDASARQELVSGLDKSLVQVQEETNPGSRAPHHLCILVPFRDRFQELLGIIYICSVKTKLFTFYL